MIFKWQHLNRNRYKYCSDAPSIPAYFAGMGGKKMTLFSCRIIRAHPTYYWRLVSCFIPGISARATSETPRLTMIPLIINSSS